MGFQLKRHISAVVGLQDELDARLNIDNIDDVLTSSATDHALSANQGRVLEDKKLDKQDIVNDLETNDSSKALSAAQGKALAGILDEKVNTSDIVDSLDSTSTVAPLSANQGRVLLERINASASGLQYRGAFDAANATELPTADAAGEFWVASSDGTVQDVELKKGDMLISNAEGNDKADWDKIDNTESPDILRTSNVATNIDENNDGPVNSAAVSSHLQETLSGVLVDVPHLKVETVNITGSVAEVSFVPLGGVILDDKVTIYNGDGTYDEWQGVSFNGKDMTIEDSNDVYDGKSCKISYLYRDSDQPMPA